MGPGQAGPGALRGSSSSTLCAADVRPGLPAGHLAADPAHRDDPRLAEKWDLHRRRRARHRLLGAGRPGRAAGPTGGAVDAGRRRAIRRPCSSTRTSCGRWSTGCRRRVVWDSVSTAFCMLLTGPSVFARRSSSRWCDPPKSRCLAISGGVMNMLFVDTHARKEERMAQKVQVLLVDDLDGGEASETRQLRTRRQQLRDRPVRARTRPSCATRSPSTSARRGRSARSTSSSAAVPPGAAAAPAPRWTATRQPPSGPGPRSRA